ncbi:MAG: ATP-binding protein [Planctomycetes bacterium]|nr:ATP-binding protein [Planctomycetota bacterium]
MRQRQDLFGRWAVLGGAVGAVALLVGHEVVTRRAYGASVGALTTVTANTLPTVLHLSELRRVVRDLELEAALRRDRGSATDQLEAQLERLWPVVEAHLDAYLALPAVPEEAPLRLHLRAAVAALKEAERRLASTQDEPTARRILLGQVVPAAAEVRAVADAIVTLNAQAANEAAWEVVRAHDNANDLSRLLLLGVAAVLAASAAVGYAAVGRVERAAARQFEELDAFAGRVAHDLKGPLQPALLATGVLGREPLSPPAAAALERLERSVRRAAALVDGLLAFARAGAEPAEGGRARVDEVVLELEPGWRHLAEEEEATLELDVTPRLDVRASAAVVGSILENLTRNALLYLGPSERRHVTVRARQDDGAVLLEVTDTGPGIPHDLLERLFRPFERGSERPGGSGLGLATVKRLAEAHGGRVSIDTRLGEGTRLRVRLPSP